MMACEYSARQVQEMPVQESINYLAISEAIMKYKLKEAGTEMMGDKECVKYTAEVVDMISSLRPAIREMTE